ncbi:AbrB/MazE/SpoVT family DNA-binding domain-containing protein [Aurantimonas endophytica]|uniref:Antitoxin MazE n=1 Tax=Aurantimonas endophytica TaxID=1522175 RepID=A0A7W6HFM8_9HYPH|nr:AbrB/MazE/SpoVT family DNA-binding domain-containing protein [Aurantimonas endophytica]MBB4004222.1 antitoxin MazE [Aurantimonas endophytica]MCO6405063.1 AbrB/MazE/SpoVT family DNA-binding domain-containing protein [Aurantimonas endophytica]
MIASVAKWGNSLALRIPQAFAKEAKLMEGGPVDISIVDGALVVRSVEPVVEYDLDVLLSGITEDNIHGETATKLAVGNEF